MFAYDLFGVNGKHVKIFQKKVCKFFGTELQVGRDQEKTGPKKEKETRRTKDALEFGMRPRDAAPERQILLAGKSRQNHVRD